MQNRVMSVGLVVLTAGLAVSTASAQRGLPNDPVLKEALGALYPEGNIPAGLNPGRDPANLPPSGGTGLETDGVAQGPDVIIGGLMTNGGSGNDVAEGILNRGSAGGFIGFGVGTTSCNLGTVNLLWDDNSTRKPVIGTAMYRLTTAGGVTKLEQIGYSWLKHGFTALTQNLCASCNGSGGWILGVGCADPYSASLNSGSSTGGSGGMGPKFEANPFTGIQAIPWVTTAAVAPVSDATSRRLRVATADLAQPTSATVKYFVEGQYITPDDAAFGNSANNASYKQINVVSASSISYVAPSGGNGTLPWGTQREKAAIYAWRDFGNNGATDPNVLITRMGTGQTITASTATWNNSTLQNNVAALPPAPVGDGEFIVGSRAYDLGNGTWRYEYAVLNFNSDRQGGSFSVPVPAGSTITDASIRQTLHHSAPSTDGVRNTPWSQTVGATSVDWASTLAAPARTAIVSNGLQWGMMSNFGFVSNVPPVEGNVSVGLYRAALANDPNPASSVGGRAWIPDPNWTPPVACYADCDLSNSLSPADFTCYLGKYRAGDTTADCDVSGGLSPADFTCFLTKYRAGCP